MIKTFASNSVFSKARAMYGKRITYNDYSNLLNCKTVNEVATYLKHYTDYRDILADLNENDVHRGQLETVLRKKIFHDCAKLARYELSVGEHLSDYIVARTEINQIMQSLMLLSAGKANEYIYSMPMFFNKHTRINLSAFASMKNYDDFLNAIKNSNYYKILKNFKPFQNQNIDLTKIETALYTYLYSTIFNKIEKSANKSTKKELNDILLTFIDLNNFTRIVRLKKYYNSNIQTIKDSLLPFGLIKKFQLEAMINAKNYNEVFDIIKSTYLGKKIQNIEYGYIDEIPNKLNFLKCRKSIRFSTNPPVVMLSYIFLMEVELSNIINIIEGVRYKLSSKEISKILISHTNIK